MIIEISKAYQQSLIPLAKSVLEPLNLSKETFEFLTTVGLALHANYHITPNAPLTFWEEPYVKKTSHLQNTYLVIASMDMMGQLVIDMKSQEVYQLQKGDKDRWGNFVEIPIFANNSVCQFMDCLGLWLSFYQQLQEEIAKNLAANQQFSLFNHKEMYDAILKKLKEVDPESIAWRKFFWRRMCEPDIV